MAISPVPCLTMSLVSPLGWRSGNLWRTYMPKKVPPKMQAKAAEDISNGVMAVIYRSVGLRNQSRTNAGLFLGRLD